MHISKVVLLIIPLLMLSSVPASGATTSFSVGITAPAQIAEGSLAKVNITLTTTNLTDVSYSLTATDGEFNNSLVEYTDVVSVNGTVQLLIYWTAPNPDQNLTVTFKLDASAESTSGATLSDTVSTTATVYTVEHQFAVEAQLSKTSLYQNESLVITVDVIDAISTDPVADATVTVEIELGTFASGTGITQFTTDPQGSGVVTATFSTLNLLFESQTVSLTISVEKVKFVAYEHTLNFTLWKVKPTASFTVSATTLTISEGKSVTFVTNAYLNEQPWANVTVKITFTAGLVNSTADSFSGRTTADGKVTFVWSSVSFPKLVEDQVIDVSVVLVHADYPDLVAKEFQITVQANTTAASDFASNTNAVPLYLALLPLVVLSRKRKR